MTCHLMNATEPCARPQCPDYVPPVEGDHLRRRSVCGRVLVDEAARIGGMSQPVIGWLLGISVSAVCQVEKRATAKLRLELAR